MNDAASIVQRMRCAGLAMWLAGERVRYAPRRHMPADLLAEARRGTPAIVAYLRTTPFDPATRPPPPDSVWPEGTVPVEELLAAVEAARAGRDPFDSGVAVASRPADPHGPCRLCFSASWWRLRDGPGDWVCGTCHPPFPAESEIERSEVRHA